MHNARKVVHVFDEPIVLGAGPGDANRVAFLKCVVADQVRWHLARDAHDRNGIHQRVGQTRDGVRRAGTRRDEHDANLTGRARVTFRRVHRAAFLAHQDVAHFLLLKKLVVYGENRATRISEYDLDALIRQRRQYDLRASHRPCHG